MNARHLFVRVTVLAAAVSIGAVCRPASGGDANPKGLHIPQGTPVNFNHVMTDGAGFRWDIQPYGSVGQGTDYAYAGGLRCQIHGSNFHARGSGWANKAGDEIEIGPYSYNNLKISRRIKVYKDRGLARWLDIFENTSSAAVTVPITIYTCTNYGLRRMETSSGGASFGEKDWGFTTESSGGNCPALLHMLCGKKSKLRPTVTIQSNQIYVKWNLTVPAGKTAILCYFESQSRSMDDHREMMKGFRPYKILRDLPPSVRALIVNWSPAGFVGVDLDRRESADTVVVHADGPKYGLIKNESFHVETSFGPLKLDAKDVVGMAEVRGSDTVRFVLVDGQVVSARVPADKIVLEIPTGGELKIPFDRIESWSYRISKDRPSEEVFKGPYVVLRTGDRLAFDAKAMQLSFRTRHGLIPLKGDALLRIDMDNPDNVMHQAFFLNGSHLGGFVEPRSIGLKLQLGRAHTVQRELISQFQFAMEEKPHDDLTHMVLTNEDEIFGAIDEKLIEVASEFGSVSVKPHHVKVMVFSKAHLGRAIMQLWDGSIVRGQIAATALNVKMSPGMSLKINPAQFESVTCMRSLPPDEVVTQARKLIAQLGAESYEDRQKASEKLIKMMGIEPILREHLKASDPEVRQRIEEILEKTNTDKKSKPAGPGNGPMILHMVG